MKLTKNFTLGELTHSDTAVAENIDNSAPKSVITKLKAVAENILQPVRDHFGRPVSINSGYRSEALNEQIGGSKTSQHSKGEAADFEIKGISNYDIAEWIEDNLDFDQLILEFADNLKNDINSGWVHCSYVSPSKNRKEVLTINRRVGTVRGLKS